MLSHRPSPKAQRQNSRPRHLAKRVGTAVAGLALATSAALAGAAVAAPAHADSITGPHAAALTYGQDVSGYEADHDWADSPAKFGIIKATEGLTFRDSSFARHWSELAKKGIVRGAYHFGHPSNDPKEEADFFLSVVNKQPAKRGDLLVLDLETSDGESVSHVNDWAKTWLSYVKAKTGVTPMFYANWDFANTYGEGLAQYPLWVADYNKPKGDVTPPADWKTWAIHQYTEDPIDQNVSLLSPDQLRALGRR